MARYSDDYRLHSSVVERALRKGEAVRSKLTGGCAFASELNIYPPIAFAMLLREALDPARLASCDATVLDYVAGTLQDEDFDWGEDALDALEAVGPLLVRSSRGLVRLRSRAWPG